MKARQIVAAAATALACLLCSAPALSDPTVYPTGTTIYDPQKAYNTYVLFGAPDGKTHLVDMNGNEVHRWDKRGFPSEILDPAVAGGKKGELLVHLTSRAKGLFGELFSNETIGELDWDGKTVWQWGKQAPGGAARQNHDWARLPNGNTLIVSTVDRIVPTLSIKSISDQVIYEIAPSGDIVWKWYAADHIAEYGIPPEGLKQLRDYLADGDSNPDGFLTLNDMQPIGPNKWFDAGDKRFDPDNIVIDSRNASFIAIIERKTGKIVWRVGPDYPTRRVPHQFFAPLGFSVPRPIDQTSGQHDAYIIPKGLPGEGNLLVFDNEGLAGYPPKPQSMYVGSRVLEINPVTKQIVWQYTALNSSLPYWSFFSSFISSARRLPNGNTLIDEGMNGRIFQVTEQGEIVWEYINPYFANEFFGVGPKLKSNWVFRAQPVPYDWVPEGTPHSEIPVKPVDNATFRVL